MSRHNPALALGARSMASASMRDPLPTQPPPSPARKTNAIYARLNSPCRPVTVPSVSIQVFDITPLVSEHIKVWPGDTPPSREVLLDMLREDNLTLSTLHTTVHVGAHADAPSHYGRDGATIEQRSLDYYLGECEVVSVTVNNGVRIALADLPKPITAPRVLIRTGTYPDSTCFNEDFAALEPELIDALASQGVRLIGVDTPSVDLFHSKDLPAHQAFLRNDMAILEGLVLADVPDGMYELIALPLRLAGFDASPVRAVLRRL